MARIRTVKIGFFRNEQLATFSFAHRLLFEGLWLIADKAGRLEDRPRRIKADLFPYDDVDVDAMLADLAAGDDPFVRRYQVAGKPYIQVCNFNLHQRPHHTEPDSTFPGPNPDTCVSSPLSHGETTGTTPPDSARKGREGKDLDLGKEGDGEGEPPEAESLPPELLAVAWNELTSKPIAACQELSEKRKRSARARLTERTMDEWRLVIQRIERSAFCRGENDRGWIATFDWLLQPDTAVKVLEGKYDNRPGVKSNVKPMMDAAEIRRFAREFGSNSWAAECVSLHDGKCGGPNAHRERMMQAVEDFAEGRKAVSA